MNFRRQNPLGGEGDPRITELLRSTYRAPRDPAYWDGLEARILARVLGAGATAESWRAGARPTEWWEVLAQWNRAGLVAAGLAAVAALAAAAQTRAAEARVAYEAVVETPPIVPSQRSVRTADAGAIRAHDREATLRYVMTH